jgi:hypothetical protein
MRDHWADDVGLVERRNDRENAELFWCHS